MSHRYTGIECKNMIETHKERGFFSRMFNRPKWRTITWPVEDLKVLINQPGITHVRLHRAMHDGEETVVISGVETVTVDGSEKMRSMLGGRHVALQNGVQCPPKCIPGD